MDDLDPSEDFNAEKARLIGSLYEVVLNPEHYNAFMQDWARYIENVAQLPGVWQSLGGEGAELLNDPEVEAHFKRAFALFERMGRGEVNSGPDEAARVPMARLERRGVVSAATAQAETLFGRNPDMSAICAALEDESAERLRVFMASFERVPVSGRFAVLSLADKSSSTLEALPAALPPELLAGGLIAVVTCRAPSGDGFVAELRSLSLGWTASMSEILADSFRLSPRETELVHALTQGGDLQSIAERKGRSLNTLRAQLKSVFAKTRTSGQSELMRLVAVLVLHGPISEHRTGPRPETGQELRIDLGEDRYMPVHLMGPEDGLPVVFVHGMLEGLGIMQHIGSALRAEGLRLIAPVRSNFGQSMHDPRIVEAPNQYARDLGVVLEALDVKRCIIVGHMAGAVYAFAAAARLKGVIAGIANVSGCVPVRSIEQFSSMTPRQRAVAYTARFAPKLLPAVLRAGIARIDSSDPNSFMLPLYPKGSPDREVIEYPRIAASLVDGYRFTVAQGPCAFQIDAWQLTRDWSALVLGSDCPVLLTHGGADPVVTAKSVHEFAEAHPRVALNELDGDGQLIFYRHPRRVVSAIAEHARACLGVAAR